jgi:hypothetical protein
MARIKKNAPVDFEKPTGPQLAVIAGIDGPVDVENKIDGGTQSKLLVTFETAETYEHDGKQKRHLVTEWVTASTHEKSTLRHWIEAIVGKKLNDDQIPEEFDTDKLVGHCVIIDLVKKGNGYVKVQSLMSPPRGNSAIKVSTDYTTPEWILDMVANDSTPTNDAAVAASVEDLLTQAPAAPVKPAVVKTAPKPGIKKTNGDGKVKPVAPAAPAAEAPASTTMGDVLDMEATVGSQSTVDDILAGLDK